MKKKLVEGDVKNGLFRGYVMFIIAVICQIFQQRVIDSLGLDNVIDIHSFCCLDRVAANSSWLLQYPRSEATFLRFYGSDHRHVITNMHSAHSTKRRRQFRFDKRLLDFDDFKDYVYEGWNKNVNGNCNIHTRIKSCRHAMSECKYNNNMNSEKNMEEIKTQLDAAMISSTATREEIKNLQQKLFAEYRSEEEFWYQKSRIKWLNFGDRNTNFYHAFTKTRYAKNTIHQIQDDEGTLYKGESAVGTHAENFYKEIYKSSNTSLREDLYDDYPQKVTLEINNHLTTEVMDWEVKLAVWSIGADRAPGPDGLTSRFYQSWWDIIGPDIVAEVKNFFITSKMPTSVNNTNLCLIPKITNPSTFSDYRPIGLCNVFYKIISKILVQRLKVYLPSIVSKSQAAFVPGRMITDNILIANELMHSLKVRKRVSKTYMSVKTDISKTYDRGE